MPIETLEPNSCDKTLTGMNACGACSAGAETCDCETASGCSSGSVEKSGAEFYNFDSAVHQAEWSTAILKVNWKLYGETDGDSASCDQNKLYLKYYTNLVGWQNFSGFPKTATGSNQTGTATASISTSTSVASIKIQAYALAECCTPCSGGDECCMDVEGREICFCSSCASCTGDCNAGAC